MLTRCEHAIVCVLTLYSIISSFPRNKDEKI